jgi:hypothetical protein
LSVHLPKYCVDSLAKECCLTVKAAERNRRCKSTLVWPYQTNPPRLVLALQLRGCFSAWSLQLCSCDWTIEYSCHASLYSGVTTFPYWSRMSMDGAGALHYPFHWHRRHWAVCIPMEVWSVHSTVEGDLCRILPEPGACLLRGHAHFFL